MKYFLIIMPSDWPVLNAIDHVFSIPYYSL